MFWVLLLAYIPVIFLVIKYIDNDSTRNDKNVHAHLLAYLRIFKIMEFWHYTVINALCMSVFFIFIAAAPAFLTKSYNISAFDTGVIMSLPPLGFVLSCFFSEKIFKPYSWNQKILFGRIIVFLGLVMAVIAHFYVTYGFVNIMICGFLIGVGNGISAPNLKSAIVSIQNHMLGSIIGLFTFFCPC